jgi:hypothetical protein
LLNWSSTPPSFDHFSRIIELCWDTLANSNDKPFVDRIGRLSARWLATFTFSYTIHKSVTQVIRQYISDAFWVGKIPETQARIDIATFTILHITRHWFDYKLPKWITVVSNIQEYVFKKHQLPYRNYAFIASSIENGFLAPEFAGLMEYGLPISAIQKLTPILNQNSLPETMLARLQQFSDTELQKRGLINYEIKKIRSAL